MKILTLSLIIAIIFTGCSKQEEVVYNTPKLDKETIDFSIDTTPYEAALEGILNCYSYEAELIEKCIQLHSDYMSNDLIERLRASAIYINTDIVMEDMGVEDEETDTEGIIWEENAKDAEQDVYSDADMGEEYVDSTGYTVLYADAYPGMVVAFVSHPYANSMKVVMNIEDGKIQDYTIYR